MDCGWMWENTHLLTLNVEKQIIVDHYEMFVKVDGWNDVKLNEMLFMEVKSFAYYFILSKSQM
jgi:hypothetical protein